MIKKTVFLTLILTSILALSISDITGINNPPPAKGSSSPSLISSLLSIQNAYAGPFANIRANRGGGSEGGGRCGFFKGGRGGGSEGGNRMQFQRGQPVRNALRAVAKGVGRLLGCGRRRGGGGGGGGGGSEGGSEGGPQGGPQMPEMADGPSEMPRATPLIEAAEAAPLRSTEPAASRAIPVSPTATEITPSPPSIRRPEAPAKAKEPPKIAKPPADNGLPQARIPLLHSGKEVGAVTGPLSINQGNIETAPQAPKDASYHQSLVKATLQDIAAKQVSGGETPSSGKFTFNGQKFEWTRLPGAVGGGELLGIHLLVRDSEGQEKFGWTANWRLSLGKREE